MYEREKALRAQQDENAIDRVARARETSAAAPTSAAELQLINGRR